jgi:hypothetical protein
MESIHYSIGVNLYVSSPIGEFFYRNDKVTNFGSCSPKKGWRYLCNYVDTSAINVRAAEAVLHLEERISGADYSVIVMI